MYRYNDVNINYQDSKVAKSDTLVYLHGWGQNIQMMEPIAKPFSKEYRTIIIDLPGHGQSAEPEQLWEIEDFAECLHSLLANLKVKNPILVGHSFGGKVALYYASNYPVKKLILLASPFRASKKELSPKVKLLKKLKKIPGMKFIENTVKKRVGSTDYRNASPIMRQILVKHINTDFTEYAKKITCPTLLIWGTSDKDVPYSDAKELEAIIPNAGLVTYENATHYAYLEHKDQVINVINVFIKSKE